MIKTAASFLFATTLLLLGSAAQARNPRGQLQPSGGGGPCPVTVNGLTLSAFAQHNTGPAPLTVFFDATATTSSVTLAGANTVAQDVFFFWTFQDSAASGSGTWANGAATAFNFKNSGTGIANAHMYGLADGAGDQTYTPTLTAVAFNQDGSTTSATCSLSVTVQDPGGSNGWPTAATACVSASGTPVAGVGGCPSGATVVNQANFTTALAGSLSGKRKLFKCGDTFTGNNGGSQVVNMTGVKWHAGAYGGCQGTKVNRPIFSNTSANGSLEIDRSAGDGRVTDIDFESSGTAGAAIDTRIDVVTIPYQITMFNNNCNGMNQCYVWSQGSQVAVIDSVMTGCCHSFSIGAFGNYNENNPVDWASGSSPFKNVWYMAWIGNNLDVGTNAAPGPPASGVETLRISACRMCVVSNNTLSNSNGALGANLKIHSGNTHNSSQPWAGVYGEYIEVSDNLLRGGNTAALTGGQLLETAPQNNDDDERLRYNVIERNFLNPQCNCVNSQGGKMMLIVASNESIRDNVLSYGQGSSLQYPLFGIQALTWGTPNAGAYPNSVGLEIYNNTCYDTANPNTQNCVAFSTVGFNSGAGGAPVAATHGFISNTLYYKPSAANATVLNSDPTGTTVVSGNTVTSTANPAFTNGSGLFNTISDFKPTANFGGAVTVPVPYDPFKVVWPPTWDLGAVHH